jgi:uncharacterized DUF497 family protein
MEFKWNSWNLGHIAEHGISSHEAEFLITDAGKGWPKYVGDGRHLVRGQTADGHYLQVIFIYDKFDGRTFVIHARPLTEVEKRRLRRRRA